MPERLDEEELADWRAGRNAVYQLAALTVARLAVADSSAEHKDAALRGEPCGVRAPLCNEKTPAGGGRGFRAGRAREKNSIVQEISNSITQ
jgi:hypothetical protein